ncbi:MAG: sulfite exporter TauE/SafE family protein [Firmicutes bacterium]|nr:sulfite exporter TauE/SafE family protein [Bacillota bacterium]
MSLIQSILAVISGGVVGLSLGLLGGGGSILAVPLLLYVVRLKDPHVVIGTSAFAVSLSAYLNLIPHARAGHVRWKPAIWLAIPGVLGALVGAYFGHRVGGKDLLFLFALLMLVIAGLMMRPKAARPAPARAVSTGEGNGLADAAPAPASRPERVLPTGFLVGALSGFFGIGGGFLIVPGLVFSSGLSMIDAIGSSLVAVGTFGLTTAISYAAVGLINWLALLEYTAGGILGGFLGYAIATRLSHHRSALNYIFSAVIIVVALYMLYRNATVVHL